MATKTSSQIFSYAPDLGVVNFFGYEGYVPPTGFSETVLIRFPNEEDFQEVHPLPFASRGILSQKGANVYPKNKGLVERIVVSPRIAALLFAEEMLSFEDLKNAREVDGGIEIPGVVFGDENDGKEVSFTCTLCIERDPKYEIYATGQDSGKIL